ncbi:hypothetical protein [Pseudomonas sp. 8O]|uniref:hypothetical protein n=1 Tax=Pseudomonas sp. 8O TaxID=2653165 RepID=UPI0012F300DB|nr:hypothetical protein [Pseudomonas sp. 8O]VXB17165.1 conserved hypothetical protein [Pseudomonas sp. 8O]
MRKVRPPDVLASFITQVDEYLSHYERIIAALKGTQNEKLDITLMSRNLFHSVFVDFECFVSDLFISYLNRDFSQYQDTFEGVVKKAAKSSKVSPWLISRITFDIPTHLKLEELADAIDPLGWNLTFKDTGQMKQKAMDWLADPYKTKIQALNDEDANLIDTARSIRNWIAHQSIGSGIIMNDMLKNIDQGPGTSNHELGRGIKEITNIGFFLKSQNNGERRVQAYARRLKETARNLTV